MSSSPLPSQWLVDCASREGAVVRAIAVPTSQAATIPSAREQVERLYETLFKSAGHPVAHAKRAAARAFVPPEDPTAALLPARTVLVYVDPSASTTSDRVAAFSRVTYDGERILISTIPIDHTLPHAEVEDVSRVIANATEELALQIARDLLREAKTPPTHPMMIWRGQVGASELLKALFAELGYSESLTDRLEMTVLMKDVDPSEEVAVPDGVEIRALDLANDDLVAVYDVLKMAFGAVPPSFQAWKQHYPQQPRFAADMSFVAWEGDRPVAVSLIELVVDGEGGEDEVGRVYSTSTELTGSSEISGLQYPDDYEDRKQKIRAVATTGYVCGIATVPELRGKRVAQSLLRHNFRSAARGGVEKIYLGTDRMNPAAVRAYERAGMVETKSENHGMVTAKIFKHEP